MSKKYKDKRCVYCATRPSEGADHVFAREFFLPEHRANLPKVPACNVCNRAKSELEHYATAILPFAARHPGAMENFSTMVPPRLAKNLALQRRIAGTMRRVWSVEGGRCASTGMFSIDWERLDELFRYITRGALWHHFGVILEPDDDVLVSALNSSMACFFQENFYVGNESNAVSVSLGEDTVVYQGLQAGDCPRASVWRFAMYGGAVLVDSEGGPASMSSTIGVITCPPAQADSERIEWMAPAPD